MAPNTPPLAPATFLGINFGPRLYCKDGGRHSFLSCPSYSVALFNCPSFVQQPGLDNYHFTSITFQYLLGIFTDSSSRRTGSKIGNKGMAGMGFPIHKHRRTHAIIIVIGRFLEKNDASQTPIHNTTDFL